MAILCDELKLLFIQTPHTGCTAIGNVLRARFAGVRVPEQHVRDGKGRLVAPRKHATLQQLMDAGLVTPEHRRSLVVAAGVRNPFDMLATEFVRTTGTEDPRRRKKGTDEPPPQQGARRGPPPKEFEPWLEWRFSAGWRDRLRGRRHVEPADFAAGADHVIRFERLQADFDELMTRLGVAERVEIPVVNTTVGRHGRHYASFYTPGARGIVEAVYGGWIERFGYRFEDQPGAAASIVR